MMNLGEGHPKRQKRHPWTSLRRHDSLFHVFKMNSSVILKLRRDYYNGNNDDSLLENAGTGARGLEDCAACAPTARRAARRDKRMLWVLS